MFRTLCTAFAAAGFTVAIIYALPAIQAQQKDNTPSPQREQGPNDNRVADAGGPRPAVKAQSALLPVTHVTLFSSGVGHFLREGEVEGSTRIDLTFPADNINDLLKSLVVAELRDGRVTSVSYDSRDPIEKTLRSFALDLTDNPGYGMILNRARGEKVEVVMNAMPTQPGTVTGSILGVERVRQTVGKDIVEVEMLNLMAADGLRSLPLSQVQRVRFLNPVIDNELKRALETLALSHDTQKKTVSLSFTGEGKRPVRVGYVTESPIWKTSYRLTADKNGKVYLQGWAVVENTSDEDWSNVRMSLISGRPISFQMDMYEPLYVPRPTVEPELFKSLRPVAYSGAMDHKPVLIDTFGRPQRLADDRYDGEPRKKSEGKGEGKGEAKSADLVERLEKAPKRVEMEAARQHSWAIESVASAEQLGEYFQYQIDDPVTLPRQKSAMLPIVGKNIEAKKLSIYNLNVQAKHPLHGFKVKNTSGLHLMQGPITVYEQGTYAGDARIMDLQPNEERLISYAVDLGMEVETIPEPSPEEVTEVKIVKGIMHATRKVRQSRTYNVKNRTDADRVLLIEHPYDVRFTVLPNDKLKLIERTREVYRFQVDVPAGNKDPVACQVVEERATTEEIRITTSSDDKIQFFLKDKAASDKVKAALQTTLGLKVAMAETRKQISNLEEDLKRLHEDQARLRANLQSTPSSSETYKRYIAKLDKQESEIEAIQEQTKLLRQKEDKQRKDFEAFVLSLDTTK